ncbi:hypothetical protein [Hahella ganghwensis]|uniref:hypothetical protein n=1 Tax=Hahella ganghwensis TaxID=286420 RepID=UPI00037B884B|nr:hypothetical protein [Hahella ganghwensis]
MPTMISIESPVMTRERFAKASGLREEQIRGQMDRDQIPTKKIGRLLLVNVARLALDCVEADEDQE